MFSTSPTTAAVGSAISRTSAGIRSRPAIFAARQRRSPATISNRPPTLRTRMGCNTPLARIELESSWSSPGSNSLRGWCGLGTSCATSSIVTSSPVVPDDVMKKSSPLPRRFSTMNHLPDQLAVGASALCADRVIEQSPAVAGGLDEHRIPVDHGVEQRLAEVPLQVVHDLHHDPLPVIMHRGEHPEQLPASRELTAGLLQGPKHVRQA